MTKKKIRRLLKGNYVKNMEEYILTDENELFIKGKFVNINSDEYFDYEGYHDAEDDDCESFFYPIESDYVTKWILKDGVIYLPNTLGRNIENICEITMDKFKGSIIGKIANFYDDASSCLFPAGAAIKIGYDDIVLASDVVKTDDGYILADSVKITNEDMKIMNKIYLDFVELKDDFLCFASQPTLYYELKIKIKPDINKSLLELITEGEIDDHHDQEVYDMLLKEYLRYI